MNRAKAVLVVLMILSTLLIGCSNTPSLVGVWCPTKQQLQQGSTLTDMPLDVASRTEYTADGLFYSGDSTNRRLNTGKYQLLDGGKSVLLSYVSGPNAGRETIFELTINGDTAISRGTRTDGTTVLVTSARCN
ncbi:MAG TPA: hypothetical protein PLD47_06805 [Aggregatilineales bacterium]|nr:hypothetical protein [Anaerolineales bacterium]HRE47418.1 hypothetical protein [Aggregatilineales bacterium]